MSTNNTQETEQLIIKLLKKLERKGKNVQILLWKLMDQFEDAPLDEKTDQNTLNINKKITLLYDKTDPNICKVGHQIRSSEQKHLSTEPCVICGHSNKQNKTRPNNKQILKFLDQYNIHQVPFGPHQNQKGEGKAWVKQGLYKKWPLHYAAITGDIAQINALCKNKNINVDQKRTDYSDTPPITFAARFGQLQSLIELVKNGANPAPPPSKGSQTPYKCAVYWKHKSITVFFEQYIKYLYNFDINSNINLECYKCYIYDLHFNKHVLNGTMSKYVYCHNCTQENVKKVMEKQKTNKIIERRIIKTLKENASISVDTLCQMKDVKSLHTILKEIMISGQKYAYSLWLLDIDNFKVINTHLTHAIADTKIQALGQILKRFEPVTWKQWKDNGYEGINNVYAFRQGGDEFALVVECNNQKISVLQKLYEALRTDINNIKLGKIIKLVNGNTMKHITVSIGVCLGESIVNDDELMKQADIAAETVKTGGKNGIAIYDPYRKKICKNFYEIL